MTLLKRLSIAACLLALSGCHAMKTPNAISFAPPLTLQTENNHIASTAAIQFDSAASSESPALTVQSAKPPIELATEPDLDIDLIFEHPSVPVLQGSHTSIAALQELALQSNPTIKQATALVQRARGSQLQAGLYPNPGIVAQQGSNNSALDMFNVFATQELVTSGKLGLSRAVASNELQRAQWQAQSQRTKVINDVHIRGLNVLAAQKKAALAADLLTVAQEGVRISQRLKDNEVVSQTDVNQAQLQLHKAEIELQNAQLSAEAAWQHLANVIGDPNLSVSILEDELAQSYPIPDWDTAYQQLLAHSPQLHAARSHWAATRTQVSREQAQRIPNVELTSGIGRTIFTPDPFMMYTVSFAVKPTIFNRNQGNVQAASGAMRAAQMEVNRLELQLRDKLATAMNAHAAGQGQVETYERDILPTAQRSLSLAMNAYEKGEVDILRVLTAQTRLFRAQADYVDSLTARSISSIEINGLLLTGGLDSL